MWKISGLHEMKPGYFNFTLTNVDAKEEKKVNIIAANRQVAESKLKEIFDITPSV